MAFTLKSIPNFAMATISAAAYPRSAPRHRAVCRSTAMAKKPAKGRVTGINPAATGVGGVIGVPLPQPLAYVGNLFTGSRPGDAVVRTDDLVALRVQLVNVARKPGSKPPVLA